MALRNARDVANAVVPTVVAVGGLTYYYFKKAAQITAEYDFRFEYDPSVSLGSDATLANAAAPSIAEYGGTALDTNRENNIDGNTLCGSNFLTNVTSFTESVPLWMVLPVVVCLLSIFGSLYCVHARTRMHVRRLIGRARAESPTVELRSPASMVEFLGRLWYFFSRISTVVSILAGITPDQVSKALTSTRSTCGQWLLAAILALLFRSAVRGPAAPVGLPQLPPQGPNPGHVGDGPTPSDGSGPTGGGSPDSSSKPPAGGNPRTSPTDPQLRHTTPDQSKCPADDDEPEKWFDAPEDPVDDEQQWFNASESLSVTDTEPDVRPSRLIMKKKPISIEVIRYEKHVLVRHRVPTPHQVLPRISFRRYPLAQLRALCCINSENASMAQPAEPEVGTKPSQELVLSRHRPDANVPWEATLPDDRLRDLRITIKCLQNAFKIQLAAKQDTHEAALKEITKFHDARKAELEDTHKAAIEKITESHDATKAELEETHKAAIEDMTESHDATKAELAAKQEAHKAAIKKMTESDDATKAELATSYLMSKQHLQRIEELEATLSESEKSLRRSRDACDQAERKFLKESQRNADDAAGMRRLEASHDNLKQEQEKLQTASNITTSAKNIAEAALATLRLEKTKVDGQLSNENASNKKLGEEIERLRKELAALKSMQPGPDSPALGHTGAVDAAAQTDDSNVNRSSPPENGHGKPSRSAKAPASGPAPSSALSVLREPSEGDVARPADNSATKGSTSSGNEQAKPPKPAPASFSASAVAPVPPVLSMPGDHAAAVQTDDASASGDSAPENADVRRICTAEEMALRDVKVPKKPRRPMASTPAPAPAPLVLEKPDKDGAAGETNDKSAKDVAASENRASQPSGQKEPARAATGPRRRPIASPLRAPHRPKSGLRLALPKPAQNTDLNQSKPGVSNAGAPTGSSAMDGVEKAPSQPVPFVPSTTPFNFGFGPKPTNLHSQNGSIAGGGFSPSITPMNGMESGPPARLHSTPVLKIDPKLLGSLKSGKPAGVTSKPDTEIKDAESDPPVPSQIDTTESTPSDRHTKDGAAKPQSMVESQIKTLESKLATLTRKRNSMAVEVEGYIQGYNDTAPGELKNMFLGFKKDAEKKLENLDRDIAEANEKLEKLKRHCAPKPTGGGLGKGADDDGDDGPDDGGLPGGSNSGDAMDLDDGGSGRQEQNLRAMNGGGVDMGSGGTTRLFRRQANGRSGPLVRQPFFPQPPPPFGLPGLGLLTPNGGGPANSGASVPTKPSNGSETALPALFAGMAEKIKRFNEIHGRLKELKQEKSDIVDDIDDTHGLADIAKIDEDALVLEEVEEKLKELNKALSNVNKEIVKLEAEEKALEGQPKKPDSNGSGSGNGIKEKDDDDDDEAYDSGDDGSGNYPPPSKLVQHGEHGPLKPMRRRRQVGPPSAPDSAVFPTQQLSTGTPFMGLPETESEKKQRLEDELELLDEQLKNSDATTDDLRLEYELYLSFENVQEADKVEQKMSAQKSVSDTLNEDIKMVQEQLEELEKVMDE